MTRILLSLTALAALTLGAQAQAPVNPSAAAAPLSDAKPAPQATPSPSDTAAQAKPAGGDTASEWSYKTKDGQMYQPPEQRPASPAMETKTYGRT